MAMNVNHHPFAKSAWLAAGLSLIGGAAAWRMFGHVGSLLWPLSPAGLFAAIYPLALLMSSDRADLDDAEFWTWRRIWRSLRAQLAAAALPLLLIYALEILTLMAMNQFSLSGWTRYWGTRHATHQIIVRLYLTHVNILPLMHLAANLALVYAWRRLARREPLSLIVPLTLLASVRFAVLLPAAPNLSPVDVLSGSRIWAWGDPTIGSDELKYEDIWLMFKCGWAVILMRLNILRRRFGLCDMSLMDAGAQLLDAFFYNRDGELDSIARLMTPRRLTRLIFWSVAAMLPLVRVMVKDVATPRILDELAALWLGGLWLFGTVLIAGRWMGLLGSPARRAGLLEIFMTPIPASRLIQEFIMAPIRHYLRLMGPVIAVAVIDVCVIGGPWYFRPLVLVGAIFATILLYLFMAPALMFNLLRHRSLAQAIVRTLGIILVIEGIMVGAAVIFGEMLDAPDFVIVLGIMLHAVWAMWSLDYLMILRGDLIVLAAAPPPREESLKPI